MKALPIPQQGCVKVNVELLFRQFKIPLRPNLVSNNQHGSMSLCENKQKMCLFSQVLNMD